MGWGWHGDRVPWSNVWALGCQDAVLMGHSGAWVGCSPLLPIPKMGLEVMCPGYGAKQRVQGLPASHHHSPPALLGSALWVCPQEEFGFAPCPLGGLRSLPSFPGGWGFSQARNMRLGAPHLPHLGQVLHSAPSSQERPLPTAHAEDPDGVAVTKEQPGVLTPNPWGCSDRAHQGWVWDAAGLIIHGFPRPDWLRSAERSGAPPQEETRWP